MKNLKNKKILFILVAFLFCLFGFSSFSFATSEDKNLPSIDNLIVDDNINNFSSMTGNSFSYIIMNNTDLNYITLYIFRCSLAENTGNYQDLQGSFILNSENKYILTFQDLSYYSRYYLIDNAWVLDKNIVSDELHSAFSTFFTSFNYIDNLLYSNIDIVNNYSVFGNNDIVFQKAPLMKTEAVEIPTIQEAQQIPEIIAKVVKMIIPVCLVILATLLIISLIQSVIYRTL